MNYKQFSNGAPFLGCMSSERLVGLRKPLGPWGDQEANPADPGHRSQNGLFARHNLHYPKGAIHVGLWRFEEAEDYFWLIGDNLLGFEANPDVWKKYSKVTCDAYGFKCFNNALSDRHLDEPIAFFAPLDRLDCGGFYSYGPDTVVKKWMVWETTLDYWFESSDYDPSNYDFLNIDAEGSELAILVGAEETLQHINYIILETSLEDRFNSGSTLERIDKYLKDFEIVETDNGLIERGWGDVFFVRK